MTIFVAALMLAAHLYIGWRIYAVLKKRETGLLIKALPFMLLLSFYTLPLSGLVYHWVWGDPDILTFLQSTSYWFWFGLVFSFQVLTWLIILDVLTLAARFISTWQRSKIDRIYRRSFGVMVGVLFVFTAVKMIYDTQNIQVQKVTYSSQQVMPAFDNFRIAHISDLQGDEYTGRDEIARYIAKVNELDPDLVIFTGDLISYGTDFVAMAAEELAKVEATYGTFAVVGDHDYWAGVSNIKKELEKYSIPLLQDRNVMIPVGRDSLLLTGITEVYSKHIPADSLKALTPVRSPAPLKVLAAHQATDKVIAHARKSDYDLLLAGHTHGGQLRVPFMFMTFSGAEQDTEYLSGTYRFGNLLMNVNNGLGFTLAPVRYNAPPTISVIDLKVTQ